MRLSESIRLGTLMRPQAFGGLFRYGGSCALGAALEAINYQSLQVPHTLPLQRRSDTRFYLPGIGDNGRYEVHTAVEAPTEWHSFLSTLHDCPECYKPVYGRYVISHLNDVHTWSRERIADFVELHEISMLAAQEQPVEETVAK